MGSRAPCALENIGVVMFCVKTKHWETNIAVETKHFETVSKQSIAKQTLQWKPNILKPLENKALGTKHCSGNQTFYCSISQNTCLKKVCISPVSDASASARGARARCAEAPS